MRVQTTAPAEAPAGIRCLEVNVLYTGTVETLAALRAAGQLACDLHATIQVLVPEVVPYPRDLQSPSVAAKFSERKFRTLAQGQQVLTKVHFVLCRDPEAACKQALAPHSLVIVGHRRHWWQRTESRLATRLRRQGHEVISVAA